MTAVSFEVLGDPAPQGSKTRMPNGAMLEGATTAQRQKHQSWRTAVADAARNTAERDDVDAPLTGPLTLSVTFYFAMPKSRPKKVRDTGSAYKTSAPDLDKLIRSVGDALKIGGLIADDALIAAVHAYKFEVIGWTGAVIQINQLATP